MDMNHTPKQMAEVVRGAADAIGVKLTVAQAASLVTAYLEASPMPPVPLSVLDKLVAGIIKALR